MRRRDVIALLGGAAVSWPLTASAQQPKKPVIGFLDRGSSVSMTLYLAGFRRGLAEHGYSEGKNVSIEYRWADNQIDRLPVLAAELVSLPVAVIAATRTSAPAIAAKGATSTIPIVFQTGGDPVKDGLVASFNQPGGNITGAARISAELLQKRLSTILQLVPRRPVGLLANPATISNSRCRYRNAAARARGVSLSLNREAMAALEKDAKLKADLEKQAAAYRNRSNSSALSRYSASIFMVCGAHPSGRKCPLARVH